MANTTIKKNAQGYGYKYSDLSEIHGWLESQGLTYYQYIEPIDGQDYIYTVPIVNGKEQPPRRGCKVVPASLSGKSNPVQEMGASLTYSRRYSLLMAFGLATADDDAECLTQTPKNTPSKEQMKETEKKTIDETKQKALEQRCKAKGTTIEELLNKCHLKSLADVTEKQFFWLSHDSNWEKLMNGE